MLFHVSIKIHYLSETLFFTANLHTTWIVLLQTVNDFKISLIIGILINGKLQPYYFFYKIFK